MDPELQDILDRGVEVREKYINGEYQGTNIRWKGFLEQALLDYFKHRIGEEAPPCVNRAPSTLC